MIIVNPASGMGRARKCGEEIQIIKTERRGFENFRLNFSDTPVCCNGRYSIANLIKNGLDDDFDKFIIVGGDGSVNEAAQVLTGTDAQLAIIPKGIGNDFAEILGIPKKTKEALEVAINGIVVPVDVGVIKCDSFPEGKIFVNVFGLGIDAQVVRGIPGRKDKGISYPFKDKLIYLFGFFEELFHIKYPEVRLKTPDSLTEGETTAVVVANSRKYGLIFNIAPDADPKDGLLDCCRIEKTTKTGIIWTTLAVFFGKHTRLSTVETLKSPSFVISLQQPFASQIDGDALTKITEKGEELVLDNEYEISVWPEALNVVLPNK